MEYPENVQIIGDRIIFPVPNDPQDGSPREGEITGGLNWEPFNKRIVTTLGIYWLDENGGRIPETERKKPYSVYLVANQENWVNQFGKIVPEGDPSAVAPEYNFYIEAIKAGENVFKLLAWAAVDAITSNRQDI